MDIFFKVSNSCGETLRSTWGFITGFAGGAVGSALSMPIQNIGNHLYFGDPLMSAKQYAFSIVAGGVIGGAVNGSIASYNGRGFMNGTFPGNGGTVPGGISEPLPGDIHEPKLQIEKMQATALPDEQMQNAIPNNLNPELKPTINRIESGTPFPHGNDGAVFQNREGLLPPQPGGYYTEYVHPTPGISGPGPARIIVGKNGDMWFTPDHYKTFFNIK